MAAPPPSAVYNFSLPLGFAKNNFFSAKFSCRRRPIVLLFLPVAFLSPRVWGIRCPFLIRIAASSLYVCTRNATHWHRKSAVMLSPAEIDKHCSSFSAADPRCLLKTRCNGIWPGNCKNSWRHRATRALYCNGECAIADNLFARRHRAEAFRLMIGKESVRC